MIDPDYNDVSGPADNDDFLPPYHNYASGEIASFGRRLLLRHVFSLDHTAAYRGLDPLLERFGHFSLCILEMLTLLLCLSLLKHVFSLDVFRGGATFAGPSLAPAAKKKLEFSSGNSSAGTTKEEILASFSSRSSSHDHHRSSSPSPSSHSSLSSSLPLSSSLFSSSLSEVPSKNLCKKQKLNEDDDDAEEEEEDDEDEDEDEDEEPPTSSCGNCSFASNHIDVSACYCDEEDDEGRSEDIVLPSCQKCPVRETSPDGTSCSSSSSGRGSSVGTQCSWFLEHYGSIMERWRGVGELSKKNEGGQR